LSVFFYVPYNWLKNSVFCMIANKYDNRLYSNRWIRYNGIQEMEITLQGVIVMVVKYWQHYSHPADIGIRGIGPTKEAAFAQAAMAMTAVITDLEKIEPKESVEIICAEEDDELLFVQWLNTLLYEMAVRKMIFSKFEIEIENDSLCAMAWGEKIDIEKHNPAVEVKAATYTDLEVRQMEDSSWLAQCIVDV